MRSVNQFIDYNSKEIGTTVSGRKGVDDSKVRNETNAAKIYIFVSVRKNIA